MRIAIRSLGQCVVCDTLKSVYDTLSAHYFLREYIPGACITKSAQPAEMTISRGASFDWRGNNIKITDADVDLRSVIVIVGALLEQKRQAHRLYQVHGAAVAINNKAIAIIGGMSGIGKTTLAVTLQQLPNAEFIGDEKFVLDGQTQTIVAACPLSKDNLKNKTACDSTLNIRTKSAKLALVVFPIITNETELTCYKLDRLKLFWHLYEEASRDIRNLNFLYNNFTETQNSFDTRHIMKQRLADIQNISNHTPAYFIRGNVSDASKFIYTLMTAST